MPDPPAITISRTLGSGGTEVGLGVARRLGWSFCDRRILRRAAEALGVPASALGPQEEHYCGFLDMLMNLVSFAAPEAPYQPPPDLPVYSRELFRVERGIMLQLARRGPSVLVGRGGFIALRDHPAALHVKVVADTMFRARFLVDRGKAPDLEAARRAIAASDRERAAFIRNLSGLDWQAPGLFHLVLDTSVLGLDGCVDRIVAEARRRFPA
jgi:cytidylate kinase